MRGEGGVRPLVLGAGPAGCAAAIVLARGGAAPVLMDRSRTPGDALCGGFLSWRTVRNLQALGVDAEGAGAVRVTRLRYFGHGEPIEAALPEPGLGLSRHALDSALRRAAIAAGAQERIDHALDVAPGRVRTRAGEHTPGAIFLASGKHDVRGQPRPRLADDPVLGCRVRLCGDPELQRVIGDAVELHCFAGGYAGIVRQENGTVNICMAVHKSRLAGAGGDLHRLFAQLAVQNPQLGRRLDHVPAHEAIQSIGAVPYGFIARETSCGLFRLGDQAAVIPSLAGEGVSIALTSGIAAASAYLRGGPEAAPAFQRRFARLVRRPVGAAALLWRVSELREHGVVAERVARLFPWLLPMAMNASRVSQPSWVTQP
ncbi:NAD(P)/FAD-dependent oxidoreductase [Qipengyuania thermophila]|uniref:NAD(P)/FAD-dependent oxidoreductase n=1 Tax=Qipengyuania thermophila TaxID=2509361 RepID=UPI0028F43798|nr:FAD-dependent monooxygenase [Qipengyuania thermophila]